MNRVPTELLSSILGSGELTQRDLWACTLVNRAWNDTADPLLYTRIELDLEHRPTETLKGFTQVLIDSENNPKRRVRDLRFTASMPRKWVETGQVTSASLFTILKSVFVFQPDIRILDVRPLVMYRGTVLPDFEVFRNLRELKCSLVKGRIDMPHARRERDTLAWIFCLPSLTKLAVGLHNIPDPDYVYPGSPPKSIRHQSQIRHLTDTEGRFPTNVFRLLAWVPQLEHLGLQWCSAVDSKKRATDMGWDMELMLDPLYQQLSSFEFSMSPKYGVSGSYDDCIDLRRFRNLECLTVSAFFFHQKTRQTRLAMPDPPPDGLQYLPQTLKVLKIIQNFKTISTDHFQNPWFIRFIHNLCKYKPIHFANLHTIQVNPPWDSPMLTSRDSKTYQKRARLPLEIQIAVQKAGIVLEYWKDIEVESSTSGAPSAI